jgi:CheY-like chemotaxis protein
VATAGVTDVARSAVTSQAKILLVDDRAENLLALEAILSSLDQELVFARSGEAAVEAALANDFAVILLDVVMPGMDGFETAAQIKEQGRAQDVPIIFLTAAGADPELAFRGYAAGAVDYISKPFDPWVLRAKISVFVDLYLKERQLRVVSDLSSLLSAIEEAAAGLAALPAALASGALTDTALTDGLAQLDGAIASLRSTLSYLPGGRPPVPPDVNSGRA